MSINFPNSPTVNQTYSSGNRSWVWTGVYWRATGTATSYTGSRGQSSYVSSNTAPLNPQVGDRWFNTNDALELVWTSDDDSSQWVEISASGFSGNVGYTGSRGIDGGSIGVGYTGSASTTVGPPGIQGPIGYIGSAGYIGSTGLEGPAGYTGSSGADVGRGYTGSRGFGALVWESTKNTDFDAISGYAYPVDTTNNPVYVTFPANPSLGDTIHLIDYSSSWSTNSVTVSPNGNKLNGISSLAILNQTRESIGFVYIDPVQGWLAYGGFAAPSVTQTLTSSYLIIAGGGGGGGVATPAWALGPGGGGAGGLLSGTFTLNSGTTYNFVVGGGGAGGLYARGSSGGNSTAFGNTTVGGGAGGTQGNFTGGNGGSGGGGAADQNNFIGGGGSGTSGQGGAGYTGVTNGVYQYAAASGGGGGGAGGSATNRNGANGVTSNITGVSCQFTGSISGTTLTVTAVSYGSLRQGAVITGTSIQSNTIITNYVNNGGIGTYTVNISQYVSSTTISVITLYYAAGGGGGGSLGYPSGTSGLGGGGNGGTGQNGIAYTGAGGGSSAGGMGPNLYGGNGGSGVVILSIPTIYYSGITSGNPTINTSDSLGYTVLTYTQSGSYTA